MKYSKNKCYAQKICVCIIAIVLYGIYHYEIMVKNEEKVVQAEMDSSSKEYIPNHVIPYCDFSDIEKKHKILKYDICSLPKYDYENTPMAEYVKKQVEENEEVSNKMGKELPMLIDYHTFDFNDDGLEDYLLCIDGVLYSGSGGHWVEIFIQEEDGSIRKILNIILRLHNSDLLTGHEAFTVLDEKTDGYYAIVLPSTNHILRYDKEKDWYEFHEGE